MYYRNVELHFGDSSLGEGDQLLPDLIFIKKFILAAEHGGLHLNPRGFFQVVIIVKFVLVQELVDGKTTIATKGQIVPDNRLLSTVGSTMYTDIRKL
jgi:hypothetical protein